ncbi:MAG: DEAD/DEAH box helicase family protein [Ruminococcus flavefaciens]|nr:DEAD/DEAH box helicase family protein [Ruminococcus flavefaciens]
MKVTVIPSNMTPNQLTFSVNELTENINNPILASLSLVTSYELGNSNEYLTSIINGKDIDTLKYGESICIFSPTGSGKTKAIEQISLTISKNEDVIILTNRRACKIQLKKDLLKGVDCKSLSDELIDKIKIDNDIEVMNYQNFILKKRKYHNKKLVLICDECHCFAEDSTFSVYPQQMTDFLKDNLDNTKRIYLTATPDDVLPIIWDIEALSDKKLQPLTNDNERLFFLSSPLPSDTRIKHTYIMKSNWSYLNFKAYAPDKKDDLIEYINKSCSDGQKSLVFINDIASGSDLKEKLGNCQHIYSDEDKKAELHDIAVNEKFTSDTLITTKVAENGLSLHDDKLSVIVAETYDLISLQQIIGRARVNRKNPREITVLIPDYSLSNLGSIEGKLYMQLKEFQKTVENPDFAMQYLQQPNPYIYYDAILKKPVVNHIGYQQLQHQIDFIQSLKVLEQKEPHAFVRKVLEIYGKNTDSIDEIFIDYDTTKECKQRILSAWEVFKESARNAEALKELKKSIKEACNETSAYPKELKSNIQIDTINDILAFAGIKERILPERKIFDFDYIL